MSSKFDPKFWEISVESEVMNQFPEEKAMWYETTEEQEERYKKEDKKNQVLPIILDIIENDLTDMQRNCIKMHFIHERSRDEVAKALGISRRVVTQHIFGIYRQGKRVGGGIEKIRKICKKRCITI